MLTNDQMTPNRFLTWAVARKKISFIQYHLAKGRTIHVCTYTKATAYKAKHANMFKATKDGAFVQSGKSWLCINHCAIRVT